MFQDEDRKAEESAETANRLAEVRARVKLEHLRESPEAESPDNDTVVLAIKRAVPALKRFQNAVQVVMDKVRKAL